MDTYLIVSPAPLGETLANLFKDSHTNVSEDSWVVASSGETCSEIYKKLIEALMSKPSDGDHPRLVVVKFGNYYGFHDVALWDQIAKWRRNGE